MRDQPDEGKEREDDSGKRLASVLDRYQQSRIGGGLARRNESEGTPDGISITYNSSDMSASVHGTDKLMSEAVLLLNPSVEQRHRCRSSPLVLCRSWLGLID